MRKSRYRSLVTGLLFSFGMLCACTNKPATQQSVITAIQTNIQIDPASAVDLTTTPTQSYTPIPTASFTSTPKRTPVSSLTYTPTPSPTPSPTAPPTMTPSLTPDILFPGHYATGGCVTFHFRLAHIDFCVEYVDVREDLNMVFVVSWKYHTYSGVTGTKHSDSSNTNMFVMDEFGNIYHHFEVGGGAAETIHFKDGDSTIGWFVFPPAKPGAHTFAFHDNDQGDVISNIILLNPIKINESLNLTWLPISFSYPIALWTPGVTEEGGVSLTHNEIPNCQLLEWPAGETNGKYKNTIAIGKINYEIYGWSESNYSVREYVAISEIEGLDPLIKPLVRVIVPYENTERCLFDISDVLKNLRRVTP